MLNVGIHFLFRAMFSFTHDYLLYWLWYFAFSERVSKAVFPQIAQQILQKPVVDLRSSSRAWKVNLIGEGADDAGGVFDETMAQMCEVRQSSVS